MNNLAEALASFDARNESSLSALQAAILALAEGPLFDEQARARFWERARGDDAPEIARLLLRAYLVQRREYRRNIADMFSDAGLSEEASDYVHDELRMSVHVQMMLLLEDAGECVEHCLDDIAEMLLDEDDEIYFVACKMLAGSPCRRFVPATTALAALSRRGICIHPFSLGEALVKASQHDRQLAETLIGAIDGDDNINAAVLSIIADLPVDQQLKHVKACQVAERLQAWTTTNYNCTTCAALNAIAEIGIVSSQASEIIERALHSGEWHIRAQAAEAAGKLRINPRNAVPKLISLLDDTEGHDYTVQQCAIRGLGNYGSQAREALPALISLKEKLMSDEDAAEILADVERSISCIGEIGELQLP